MGSTKGHSLKRFLIVSQSEPDIPPDGMWWYKPELCTTTTTTICFPDGDFGGSVYLSGSYTPTVGDEVDFHSSGLEACDALEVINGGGGTFTEIMFDRYYYDGIFCLYYHNSCVLVSDGYYIYGNIIYEYAGGTQIGVYDCPTTTTTTVFVPTTTTTTNNLTTTTTTAEDVITTTTTEEITTTTTTEGITTTTTTGELVTTTTTTNNNPTTTTTTNNNTTTTTTTESGEYVTYLGDPVTYLGVQVKYTS